LQVTDNQGGTGTATRQVTVRNRGPVAHISFTPPSPQSGEQISFSGAASTDPDGVVDRYEWDLDGDGSFETDSGTTASASRSYERSGTYTVGLRVTDDDGDAGETTTQVAVRNREPVAAIDAIPGEAATGETVRFDASESTDPDGTVSNYEWDLDGDGGFETDTGSTAQAETAYPKSGDPTVTVRVTDDEGATGVASVGILIHNRPPTAAIVSSSSSPDTGETVTFDASGSADPDGEIANYEWDLDGDGAFEVDAGDDPTIGRSFARSGTYTVNVRVTDDEGATASAATEVLVANTAPHAALGMFPSDPVTFETVSLEAAGSVDPDGAISSYVWDLDGDGGFETDTGNTSRATTSYTTPGPRTVRVRITDDEGLTEEASVEFTVRNRATGFALSVTKAGQAGFDYTALRPVDGRLDLRLLGSGRKTGARALATRVVTSAGAGAIELDAGIDRVGKRCKKMTRCTLVARATASVGGIPLYDQSQRVRVK
jgi:hypothetical protein